VLAAAIRFTGFHIAIAYQKMHMEMVGIGMHREHHFVAFAVNKMFREFLCDLECQLMIEFSVVVGVKRDRHFVCEYRVRLVLAITFSIKFSRDENIVCKIISVAAKRGVQVVTGFDDTLATLFGFHSDHIQRRRFQLPDSLARCVININISERQSITVLCGNINECRVYHRVVNEFLKPFHQIHKLLIHSVDLSRGDIKAVNVYEIRRLIEIVSDVAQLVIQCFQGLVEAVNFYAGAFQHFQKKLGLAETAGGLLTVPKRKLGIRQADRKLIIALTHNFFFQLHHSIHFIFCDSFFLRRSCAAFFRRSCGAFFSRSCGCVWGRSREGTPS